MISVPVEEFKLEWEQLRPDESALVDSLNKGIHTAMSLALREMRKGDEVYGAAYYADLTDRLRLHLSGVPMPSWMTPKFWAVEKDPSMPGFTAHRVIPTTLLGRNPTLTIVKGVKEAPVFTARLDQLFVTSDSAVMALAGLARVVASRES